jgi:glycosyltransferase involved in cell wall biosynthesis
VRRAVVLVGGPAAPYARAIRIARALAADGFDVEIAAIAAPGQPETEAVPIGRPGTAGEPEPGPRSVGRITIRRYRPSGPWAAVGVSRTPGGVEAESTEAGDAVKAGEAPGRASTARRTVPRSVRSVLRILAEPVLLLRRWLLWPHAVRGWWTTLARELEPADVYHAFGTLTIAAALDARRRHPVGPSGRPAVVIYDAIDDAIGSNAALGVPRGLLRRRTRIEAGWARAADARVTVNDVLADRFRRRWGLIDAPLVVPNVPEPPAGPIEPVDLRAEAGLPSTARIVLFQGRLGPGLGLEAAADAVLEVPDAALVLLGFGRGMDAARARDRDPLHAGHHATLPARHPDELARWTAAADVAIVPLPPISPNQRAATPNKFWEALAVGTPVVIVHRLEVMERLVGEHDLGAVAASASAADLAAALRSALDRVTGPDGPAWRASIASTAAERFSWPPVAAAYRRLVRELVDEPASEARNPVGTS